MIEVRNHGTHGECLVNGQTYTTWAIMGAQDIAELEKEHGLYKNILPLGDHFNLQGFTVATHGPNNQLPHEVKTLIKKNATLPEILKKQVRIMYGQGLGLYVVDDNADATKRKWVSNLYADVLNWAHSWDKDPNLEPIEVYAKLAIQDYYYMEGFYNRWIFNKSRRIGGALPVRGLKFMNGVKCRLAKNGLISPHQIIKDADCDVVCYTDWRMLNMLELEYWPRFDKSDPFKNATSVNYVRDLGFDEEIYSDPTFFAGLLEWILGSNLNPKYINSYLRNSLSAKIHVKIPNAWIEKNTEELRKICNDNYQAHQDSKPLIKEYGGIEVGTIFSYNLVEQLINKKIEDATAVLSGEGKNQGKTFWSRTFKTEFGIEEWNFVEIPLKYAEFIKSLIDFDTAALKRILAGKGVDPAISNIGNEGVFNSGAQVYYSYLVYLDTCLFAEEIILQDLNRALWLNFPRCQAEHVKFGFKRFAPPRQQDVNPASRLDANGNPVTQPVGLSNYI